IQYSAKAVIRYINGDVKEYKKYNDKAMKLYHRQGYGGIVADEIPDDIKEKLYRMVN
ncbi:MAG: hypothetical protein GX800_12715, partial [Clostridiaceae bacterium]|nr:hypothetical protein [Clostridiaceae bacterium]